MSQGNLNFELSWALVYYFELHQMDVKIHFLNGNFNEEGYISQPQGFEV